MYIVWCLCLGWEYDNFVDIIAICWWSTNISKAEKPVLTEIAVWKSKLAVMHDEAVYMLFFPPASTSKLSEDLFNYYLFIWHASPFLLPIFTPAQLFALQLSRRFLKQEMCFSLGSVYPLIPDYKVLIFVFPFHWKGSSGVSFPFYKMKWYFKLVMMVNKNFKALIIQQVCAKFCLIKNGQNWELGHIIKN